MLGDRRVDHPAGAEFLQQALADLVGALIFGDFLAHQEHQLVAAHFFRHGVAQGIAHGLVDEFGAGRDFRFGSDFDLRRGSGGLFFFGFRFGGFGFRRLGLLNRSGTRRFAIGEKRGDGRIDLHAFGAFGHQDLADLALVHRFEFHGGLVGLDLGQDGAGLDGVALFDQPFGEFAFLHGGRKRRHQDLGAHQAYMSV